MQKGPSMDISIAVTNYNTSKLLEGALRSIVETADNLAVDIVVIDDGSTDDDFAQVRSQFEADQRFSFIEHKKNIGLVSLNVMLERARGRFILLLDSDAVLHPCALKELLVFMETHPDVGAAAARFYNRDGSIQRYYRRLLTPWFWFLNITVLGRFIDKYFFGLRNFKKYRYDDIGDPDNPVELEQPSITCFMFRREAVGPYIVHPDMRFHFADIWLCWRIYNRGYRVYLVPSAGVTHLKSASFNKTHTRWLIPPYYHSMNAYFRHAYPLLAPFIWVCAWFDRGVRLFLRITIAREPFV